MATIVEHDTHSTPITAADYEEDHIVVVDPAEETVVVAGEVFG